MKKILILLIVFITSSYTFADYKEVVENVLESIQTTNQNKSDYEKKQTFQNYIPKIQKLTIIDSRVKTALITYLNAKIDQLKEVDQNKWLGEITNINQQKVRDTRLQWHNDERNILGLADYSYDTQLEQTATTRAKYLSKLWSSTHKRKSTDGYYNYTSIKEWFWEQGITFPAEKNGAANFSENIAIRRNYTCNSSDCTNYLINRIKDGFDFFLNEKYKKNYDERAHYRAIAANRFTQIGVGIAINPSTKKIFIVTHYSVDF